MTFFTARSSVKVELVPFSCCVNEPLAMISCRRSWKGVVMLDLEAIEVINVFLPENNFLAHVPAEGDLRPKKDKHPQNYTFFS